MVEYISSILNVHLKVRALCSLTVTCDKNTLLKAWDAMGLEKQHNYVIKNTTLL